MARILYQQVFSAKEPGVRKSVVGHYRQLTKLSLESHRFRKNYQRRMSFLSIWAESGGSPCAVSLDKARPQTALQ